MDRRIRVHTQFVGMHKWEGAPAERVYLGHLHRHRFYIEGIAEVDHNDRDVEFHDLKQEMDEAIGALRRECGCQPHEPLILGDRSCEDVAEYLLHRVPVLSRVIVSEDGECAADLRWEEEDCEEDPCRTEDREVGFPEVVCICGSTRFKEETIEAARDLARKGRIVLSVEFFAHADGIDLTEEEKKQLDRLHRRKIDMADRIYVVNPNGYVGESTKAEIEYADKQGKEISSLEPLAVGSKYNSGRS